MKTVFFTFIKFRLEQEKCVSDVVLYNEQPAGALRLSTINTKWMTS